MSASLEKAVQKIYEKIANDGNVNQNQMALILMYEKQNKPKRSNDLDKLITYGKKIINIINKNMEV